MANKVEVLELFKTLKEIEITRDIDLGYEDFSLDYEALKKVAITPLIKKLKTFVVLDLETTGMSSNYGDKIVQVSAIKFVNGKPSEIFETLVNPKRHISFAASNVHGIYDEDVINKPLFSQIKYQLLKFVDEAILVGHNIRFDISFLLKEGVNLKKANVKIIDTLGMARKLISKYQIPNYRLMTLCQYFDLDFFKYHNAKEDTMATGLVYLKLLDLIED